MAGAAADTVARLRGRILPPRRLLARTSSPTRWEFAAGGAVTLTCLDLAGLRPDDRVLDIGSGVGRVAIPLTGVLSPAGSYTGVDMWDEAVAWCRRTITPRFAHFTFVALDLHHRDFHPHGGTPITEARLPFDDGHFDLAVLVAINHLSSAELRALVVEAGRLLRPGGTYMGTWFLRDGIDDDRLAPHYAAVSTTEAEMESTLAAGGLRRRAVHRGSWRGRGDAVSMQDVVIADRLAP